MNEQDTIYVALLHEGLDVWRPVAARRRGALSDRPSDAQPSVVRLVRRTTTKFG
jgi:hypothetical protein